MNKMDKALREIGEMDELAARSSPVHDLSAPAKLLSTIAYIITVVSFDKYDLSGLVPLDRQIILRLGTLAVSGGTVSMLTLMLKGVLCLMASFLLVATTPFDSICAALRRLHVPKTLVTLLLLTYRYVGVMTEELAVMTDAYHLRAPGQKGIRVSAWGSFLGQLLLRSMDRAQELYASMLLRGYHQHFHYAPQKPFGKKDAVFLGGSLLLFALLRFVDVAQLLGGLFVR